MNTRSRLLALVLVLVAVLPASAARPASREEAAKPAPTPQVSRPPASEVPTERAEAADTPKPQENTSPGAAGEPGTGPTQPMLPEDELLLLPGSEKTLQLMPAPVRPEPPRPGSAGGEEPALPLAPAPAAEPGLWGAQAALAAPFWSLTMGNPRALQAAAQPPAFAPEAFVPPTAVVLGALDLQKLALQAGPAVLVVKAWDRFGTELVAGCGFFVSADGKLLADGALLANQVARQVDYFTAVAGDGTSYRVTGLLAADQGANLALLQATGGPVPFLELLPATGLPFPLPVAIAAQVGEKDITLSDAVLAGEKNVGGIENWLQLHGSDAPGTPGSPVLDQNGRVIGVVIMQVPGERWLNFAVPSEVASGLLASLKPGAQPLATRRLAIPVGDDLLKDSELPALQEALAARNSDRAVPLARRIVGRHPRVGEAWGFLGLALESAGQRAESLSSFEKAVNLKPNNPELWSRLAAAYRAGNNPDGAFAALQEVVKIRPQDALAWYLLGERYAQRSEWPAAAEALQQVLRLDPGNAKALYLLGFAQTKTGNLLGAEGALLKSLAVRRDSASGWFLLGLVYTEEGRPQQAVSAFRQVVRIEPRHPHAWLNLAKAYKASGESVAARKAYLEHGRLRSQPASAR